MGIESSRGSTTTAFASHYGPEETPEAPAFPGNGPPDARLDRAHHGPKTPDQRARPVLPHMPLARHHFGS